MCAINGILDYTQPHPKQVVGNMNQATVHRGPDHQQVWQGATNSFYLSLGNNRLNIIDKDANSNQPMVSDDGNFILSFNGEIYNYFDLKNELLQKGYHFKSSSDSEVLLYSLIEFGKNCIHRLNGMFAFLFADLRNEYLLAARDASGMKKLYYHQQADRWLFSSEIRGVLASGLVEKKLNESQINQYLLFNYALPPATFFNDIHEVLPGEIIEIKGLNNSFSSIQFNSSGNHNLALYDDDKMLDQLEEVLINSVFRHCETSYPYGLLLSGGVDSTLLLALMSNHINNFIPTYSVVSDPEINKVDAGDREFSRKAAKKYNSEHFELEVGSDIDQKVLECIYLSDQPIGDIAAFTTHLITRSATGKVRVLLSGAGADEYFAGYNRHWAMSKYLQYPNLSRLIKQMQPLINKLPGNSGTGISEKVRLLKKLANSIGRDPGQTAFNFLTNQYDELKYAHTFTFDLNQDPLNQFLQHDRQNFLIHDILNINDFYGMQNQVEIRSPYLDRELLHACRSLNASFLLKKNKKWLLKRILTKYGGKEFCDRSKTGFGIPVGRHFMKDSDKKWLKFLLNKERYCYQYVNFEMIQKTVNLHQAGKMDLSRELWSVFFLAVWLEKEFGNEDRIYSSIL